MADYLITGIAQTTDPAELKKTLLEHCRLDAERVIVINKIGSTAHDDAALRVVRGASSPIFSGDQGTGVPGMGSRPSLSSLIAPSHAPNYLANVAIPQDVAENYNIAIDEGRSVVTYTAAEDETAPLEEAFRACGLRNVKTFKTRENHG
jgi:hypothetical protein